MTTKLTLTMEDSVIDSAKKYARERGKSLSDIVENYLKSIATPDDNTEIISPKVLKMMGVIKLPQDYDYKQDLRNALTKKYKL
ncbi:MAG: hypothetical protein EOO44_21310 [Flavobacterium sp.]|uniref:DUF6364 family protein n=1 Tax=Pedobacter agri TaxID=454586 RepID=UPI0012081D21|nr:DUF6364 family protein [Pedobacter agri]RZJ48282.1 MAG: hypothetical protein EOO44_21310 [Flavobacterium sp.]